METQIALKALAALAHQTRLDLFRTLVQTGREGLPAGSIGALLELPSATLSFHLKELKSCGLIDCECRGRSRIYRANFSAVRELLGFLTANCCDGLDGARPTIEGCEFGNDLARGTQSSAAKFSPN